MGSSLFQKIKYKLRAVTLLYRIYGGFKFLVFPIKILNAKAIDAFKGSVHKGLPVPPPKLRFRVHGSLNRESFFAVGEESFRNILESLAHVNVKIDQFQSILDFGCGSGRILRNLKPLANTSKIFGTDIDKELIQWCQKYLPFAEFSVNDFSPPLKYPNHLFGLIIGVSVFTHINEDAQHAWLKELKRISKPGGFLILTTLGKSQSAHLSTTQKSELEKNGFLYEVGMKGSLKLDGLPDYYQTAYHTKEYVLSNWSKYFKIRHCLEKAMGNYQDIVILENV